MALNSWPGLIAVILSIICFIGTTYVVIALNVGWRFGYWLASACFGALMVLLSIFWIVNPVGPRGAEPHWAPLAAAEETISQAKLGEQTFASPSQYPTGPWQTPPDEEAERTDALSSAVTACISTDPETLPEAQKKPCSTAQDLMPPPKEIPVIDGSPVVVLPEVTNIRFARDQGALLGQAVITPLTRDPRVADDVEKGERMGEPFRFLAVYDEGSIVLPAYGSLLVFLIYTAIHMLGLHRAEQRRDSIMTA